MTANGYEHAGGFKPVPITVRRVAGVVLVFATYIAGRWWLEERFGRELINAVFQLVIGAYLGFYSVRGILHAERFANEDGEPSRRKVRIWGMGGLVAATLMATLSIQTLFFPE